MLPKRLSASLIAAALLCLLGPAGCGGAKGNKLTGSVVLPPGVKMEPNDSGGIRFIPAGKTGKVAAAGLDPKTLTFTAKDVQPGKYKVGLTLDAYPGPARDKRQKVFEDLGKRYNPDSTSPLTYEVTADPEQSIVIDLSKNTVTKK